MTNAIKKNQKKLMAIFAVLLMISFVATIGTGRSGGASGREDTVVAHIGSKAVYLRDMQAAKEQWSFLKSQAPSTRLPIAMDALVFSVYTNIPRPPAMDKENSLAARFWEFRYGEQIRPAVMMASTIMSAIDHQAELFYLLQAEAEQNGIRISAMSDEVNEYLRNSLNFDPNEVPEASAARQAVRGILLAAADIRLLMDAVKISKPDWQHTVAGEQQVRLNLVDYRTSEFEKSIAAPTTQALEKHFDQFKNFPTSQPNETNPLGFGYQIPPRVMLQYITIPKSAVFYAVMKDVAPPSSSGDLSIGGGNPKYLWTVKAAAYYEDHKEEYRNPQPTSKPTTTQSASTEPTTQAASQPVYKPFEEVKNMITDKLAADEVEKLSKKIAADITSRLNSDYKSIAAANPASTQPTTEPAAAPIASPSTQPADNPATLAHLEVIRAQIEQTYHVGIELHEISADWQTAKELGKLEGIGTASTSDSTPFAEYATRLDATSSLHVWQPSDTVSDNEKNAYIFRLTAAQPAHAPALMQAIAGQVETDWKLSQCYDMAKESATKLFNSSKTVGLPQAARTAGQDVRTTQLFSPNRGGPIPGYPLEDPEATRKLHSTAEDLLKQATPSDSKPDKLIELPSVHRVLVTELAGAQLGGPEAFAQQQATDMEQQRRMEGLMFGYFDYNKVVERLGYKAEER